ncbi:universal stress protein [Nocardioides sp.]|uniref:universal stress protein n=1 Tax=Nocardioides sp. TaxID=35761 RepID=UPI002ED14692
MDRDLLDGSVVVGVDGSEHSDRALVWAAEQAALEGRRLVVLHAYRNPVVADPVQLAVWSAAQGDLDTIMDTAARHVVDEAVKVAQDVNPKRDVHPLVAHQDPRDALLDASTRAHLVVVGSHGRSGWRRLALGSVATAVAQNATSPVVVVRDPAADGQRSGVLVGADGTPSSVPVIEFAFRHASQRGLPLTVMHAYWDVAGQQAYGHLVGDDEPGVDDLRAMLSASTAGLREKYPDVEVDLQLARGLVDVVLTGDEPPRDLIVVGRRHPSRWSRLLYGSATTAVLDLARSSVAVVPEPDPDPNTPR